VTGRGLRGSPFAVPARRADGACGYCAATVAEASTSAGAAAPPEAVESVTAPLDTVASLAVAPPVAPETVVSGAGAVGLGAGAGAVVAGAGA
jgi:hypothetical protein